jgi:hypothetical protein
MFPHLLADLFAALGLLVCVLWLVHTWLPEAQQQRANRGLRRSVQCLRQWPNELRGRRGGRQAREQARAAIERARREATGSGGQVHDLERFRRQRETEKDSERGKH